MNTDTPTPMDENPNMITPNQRLQNGQNIFAAKMEILMEERTREIRKASGELIQEIKSLKSELAAVTEERDELIQQVNIRRSNNLRLDRINREQQELIEHIKRLSGAKESDCVAMREMATKIFDLREQRDTLAEALNDLWHRHSLTEAAYELIEKSLATLQPQPLKTR